LVQRRQRARSATTFKTLTTERGTGL